MTSKPSYPAYGVLDVGDDRCVLRYDRYLTHSLEQVWEALTEPGELAAWWGDAQVELIEGGRFVLSWLNTLEDGTRAVMHGTITALEPPRLLEITGDIHGVLRFELRAEGAGTHLLFSSTLELPSEFRTKVLAGWHFHLDALATALAGGRTDLYHLPGWDEIHQQYLERLRPEPRATTAR